MTDDKSCPPPKEVDDFIFKQASIGQICEEFASIPVSSSLIATDSKRGLLYIGHEKKLFVIKPDAESNPEWKLGIDLPDNVCRIALSCDCSFLAVTFTHPAAIIYDANTIHRHKLDILHEIRLSSSGGNVVVSDLKWNPAIPEMLCSVTSDHTVGCFQVSKDKKTGVQIVGLERVQGLEAVCVSWSPKGKQLVVGCKNGDIVQLKPELKVARHLPSPNPTEGIIISILWVSNYQFCACYYRADEQCVSVMIVDAPKGVTTPKLTNYEDITYGSGSTDGLVYYFEYIPEWGTIIAASSHSSEVSVLGTYDNGTTWNQLQLMDGSSAQLPLNRKKKTENFPVGIAIDKSPSQKLPWGTENTLPNPVPILRILVTSGQLCCYHIVNLKPNAPCICSPPTENVPTPPNPRQNVGPTEVSFNIPSGATSTPRSKPDGQFIDRPKISTHMFGDSSNTSFSFPAPGNRGPSEIAATGEIQNLGFSAPTEPKPTGLFGQGDGKPSFFQQENKSDKPGFMSGLGQKIGTPAMQTFQQQQPLLQQQQPLLQQQQPLLQQQQPLLQHQQPLLQQQQPLHHQQPLLQQQQPLLQQQQPLLQHQQPLMQQQQPAIKSTGILPKPDARSEFKIPAAPLSTQTEFKQTKEQPKELPQYRQEEPKTAAKETPAYDDSICLRAYYDEQAKFEKELRSKFDLELRDWSCGTEEERQFLVKKTEEIDEFLRELRETTNSLASDIAYLKALLLQSFAWLEETKSKNSANVSLTSRNRGEGSKFTDLQRLYYYTQSQLIQATKALDLEWADVKNREASKMKIPSLEVIYQSLIRYNQIIKQEKKVVEDLTKKWRNLARGGKESLTSLDRSLANLNLSQSSTPANDAAIELRCKLIATNTRNFSQEKQTKLRDLLSESAPRIVRAVRPTAVQDRLEATLSSLASSKAIDTISKPKPTKTVINQQQKVGLAKSSADQAKSKTQNTPLSSLDNLVSGIGGTAGLGGLAKSPSSAQPFASFSPKPSFVNPTPTQAVKSKENINMGFGQTSAAMSPQAQPAAGLNKPFGSVSFAGLGQKPADPQTSKENVAAKLPPTSEPSASKFSIFNLNSFGKIGAASEATSPTALPNIMSVPKPPFSFSMPAVSAATTPQSFASVPKSDSTPAFKFSPQKPTTQPAAQSSAAPSGLDLSSLNFGARSGLIITPVPTSDAKTTAAATTPSASSGISFGKPATSPQLQQQQQQQPTSLFGQAISSPQPSAGSIQSLFGKSATAGPPTTSAANKPAIVSSASAATSGTQAASTPASAAASTAASTTPSQSIFGTSNMFGALSSPASLSASFGMTLPSTQAAATSAPAASTTAIAFGAPSVSTPSSTPDFGGLLGATASLSFGTPSTGAATAPAFGKTTTTQASSIFGSTAAATAASTAAASTVASATTTTTASPSSMFGKTEGTAATTASPFGGTSTATTTTTGSVFGSIAAPATGTSIFGGQTATAATPAGSKTEGGFFGVKTPAATVAATAAAPTSSVFGGTATSAPSAGIFGSTSAAATPAFGAATTATPQSNVFGSPSTTQSTTSIFGSTAAAQNPSSVFGGATSASVFGSASTTAATPAFGATTTATPAFGATATPTPAFGTATTSSSSIFGGAAANSGSIFGGGTGATGGATSSVFGSSATPSSSIFGASAATAMPAAANPFGAAATANSPPAQSGSIFGSAGATSPQPAAGGIFGAAATSPGSPTGGSIFGAPAALGGANSMFGGATSPGGSMFGQSSTFGSKPVFGSPPGATGGFGSGFGSPPAFGGTPAPAFGNAPVLGASSPLGNNANKVFGSNTFETLGAQTGGLSFGSLAQKTTEPDKPQAFQGSSSFSSWR